jgi:transposase
VIVDAILYVVDNGIKWRALPADFPPWQTVYKRFAAWEKVGASQRLPDALRDRVRLAEGRVAAPSAAVMDSQSVRAAATVGRATRGWDGGKKVAGRSLSRPRRGCGCSRGRDQDRLRWPLLDGTDAPATSASPATAVARVANLGRRGPQRWPAQPGAFDLAAADAGVGGR